MTYINRIASATKKTDNLIAAVDRGRSARLKERAAQLGRGRLRVVR